MFVLCVANHQQKSSVLDSYLYFFVVLEYVNVSIFYLEHVCNNSHADKSDMPKGNYDKYDYLSTCVFQCTEGDVCTQKYIYISVNEY